MLLSLKHGFLFVHIAKTGGTSVRAALNRLRYTDPWYPAQFLCSRLSALSGHRLGIKFPRHAKIVAAQQMLPQETFASLFKFAYVRNPWDLQVSSYHHIRRERPHLIAHVDSFEQFMHWKLDPTRPYQYHVDTSIELQSDYLVDLHGNVLVDHLGRYERLSDDFALVCERIGVKPPFLPHHRRADVRERDYRTYYDDALAERVAQHFARDLALLDYCFDPVSTD